MPRRYGKRPRYNRDKYSFEQTNFLSPTEDNWTLVETEDEALSNSRQWYIPLINPTTINGMRKVKHLTITLSNYTSDANLLFYAIVFVPDGYSPQPIQFPSANHAINNYSANQFVM